ncbi:MAG: tetratricopeptide repeat protein, partial [Thermoanaerobaculia bacterium]
EAAVGMFEIALEFDRDYAPAYCGLADALAQTYERDGDAQLLRRADAASQRAVELAPQHADSHLCRGRILLMQQRTAEARAEFEIALSITPGAEEAVRALNAL